MTDRPQWLHDRDTAARRVVAMCVQSPALVEEYSIAEDEFARGKQRDIVQ